MERMDGGRLAKIVITAEVSGSRLGETEVWVDGWRINVDYIFYLYIYRKILQGIGVSVESLLMGEFDAALGKPM